ncbi:hypothetical protein [Alloalcanivorax gelatiniphagus]|uniref:Uncharacterized protein n=1 Tax=Alloalcanivorax gelatiniphagus TaxID=1194167 RepID=A0ABY2XRT3_9GAMM|nr:hypothetical protein [Alloalcanivorax gelatiniphagus]TMW14593.1 hypothetical protein FGS76_02035 [Alloalcanivorax gelatiniphagus]
MTKPYDVERTEVCDMASLAVEQFNYLEALFSALANRLDAFDPEDRTLRDAKRLALLGRSHAEQWACAFLDETNG